MEGGAVAQTCELHFSYEYESGVGGHHEISLMARLPLRGTNVLQIVHLDVSCGNIISLGSSPRASS